MFNVEVKNTYLADYVTSRLHSFPVISALFVKILNTISQLEALVLILYMESRQKEPK